MLVPAKASVFERKGDGDCGAGRSDHFKQG
jgi:hypothetical protein